MFDLRASTLRSGSPAFAAEGAASAEWAAAVAEDGSRAETFFVVFAPLSLASLVNLFSPASRASVVNRFLASWT